VLIGPYTRHGTYKGGLAVINMAHDADVNGRLFQLYISSNGK
jgi:hypothetical protein